MNNFLVHQGCVVDKVFQPTDQVLSNDRAQRKVMLSIFGSSATDELVSMTEKLALSPSKSKKLLSEKPME